VAAVISLKGIDQAIADLNYQNENTLKYRLVHAIRRHYEDESSVGSIQGIDAEELVKVLWDTGDDPEIIKNKRKNLSSIKSSVNADLKNLYSEGKNPEGITIGRSNLFVMGSEAKDQLLTSFTSMFASDAKGDASVNLGQIGEALNVVSKILSTQDVLADDRSPDGPIQLEKLRSTIEGLAQKVGLGGKEPGLLPQASEDEQSLEAVEDDAELAEDAEIVEEVLAEEEAEPEEVEEAEEIGEDELEEVLEEVDLGEAPEAAEEDLDETELEEALEEVQAEEALDEVQAEEALEEVQVEVALEEVEAEEALDEAEAEEVPAEVGLEEEAEEVDEEEAEIVEEVLAEEEGPEETEEAEVEEEVEEAEVEEAAEIVDEAEAEEVPDEDGSVSFEQISEAANIIDKILSSSEVMADAGDPDRLSKLEELRHIIRDLSQDLGVAGKDGEGGGEKQEGPEVVGPGTEGVAGDGDFGRGEVIAHEGALAAEGIEDEEELEETEVEEAAEIVDEAEVVEEVVPEEEEEEEEIEEADEDEVIEEERAEPEDVEEIEELDEDGVPEDLEDVEVIEDLDEGKDTGGADVEAEDGLQEMGLPVGSFGEEFSERDDGTRKNKLLAEAFDGYLGAMERFYNQYLLIPEGEYIVGSKAPEKDEQPEHRVRLSPFYMGKFPVTNALFEIFVEKTGYKTTAEKLGYATVYYGRLHKKVDEKTGLVKYTFNAAIRCETVYGACWYQPFGPDSTLYDKRNHPVVQVRLEDAMAFAAWTGKRLPKENEWEAAARTADGRVFPWGNDMKGNSCNIEESSVADTTVVNKYIEFENDFGIVDAIGNVLEWTLDTCEPPSYVKNTSIYRIVKGGSWISGNDVRLFSRFRWNGQLPSNILGFRCVAF